MDEIIYRPQHKSEQEIRDDFVIRLVEFDKIMNSIKSDQKGKTPQHIILQGQRGTGKTTLMYRVYYQVMKDYRKKGLVPVIFSEEQYSVRTLYKLWEEVARYLEDNEPDYSGIWYKMQEAQDDKDYEEKCFELLQKSIKKNKHRLLLLIDNFGVMLDKFKKQEQQRFREILTTFPGIKILGGSAVVLESFYKYDKPFFDFFKIMQLEALTSKEVRTLLLRLGKKHKTEHVKEIVKNQPGRIESMRILSGGVPRTIVLLFNIFLDSDHGNSIEDLTKLLDLVTPLYKHRMDELPDQQQEIVDKLALNWDGMSVSELVKRTRMESKALSAQLNNLVKSGVVIAEKSTGKNKYYQLEERFFNIWYLMQHAPKSSRQKVIWLTRFLEHWCPGKLLEDTALGFAARLKKEKVHPEYIKTMTSALACAEGLSHKLRDEVIEAAGTALEKGASLNDLPLQYDDFLIQFKKLVEGKKYPLAISLIERASLPDGLTNALLGAVYEAFGKFKEAELCFLKAVEKEDARSMYNLALLYEDQYEDYEKAEKYYLMAVKKDQAGAMINLALLYECQFKDYKKAEKYYLMAVKKEDSSAMYNLALFYEGQFEDSKKAEKYYLMAVKEEHSSAMYNLALLYHIQYKDYKKAEEYYLMAVKKEHSAAMVNLALLYEVQFDDYKKAEKYYLIAIKHENTDALNNMINFIIERNKVQRVGDAKLWADKLLKNKPDNKSKLVKIRYLIWINESEEAATLLEKILPDVLEDDDNAFLLSDLLAFAIAKGLRQYVLKLFQQEEYQLKDRFKVLYYALMKLLENEYPNEIKKMGKELEEPVTEMVNYIEELEKEYL